MKINEWTLGLAAVGVVSLASVAQADENKLVPLMTDVASTTLSGFVDTSAIWRPGTGSDAVPVGRLYDVNSTGSSKQDGFNLNVVSLVLDKPLDEGKWSAGYHVEALIGPDANAFNSGILGQNGTTDFGLAEAYVALRAPIGNGLDFKFGQFGNFGSYETFDSYKNPNYSRSYGYYLNPHDHVGVTTTYNFAPWLSVSGGVGNAYGNPIDSKADSETSKYYMGALTVTAPESSGFLKGSTLTLSYEGGPQAQNQPAIGDGAHVQNFYAGATINTPVKEVSVGASLDYQEAPDIYARALAGYLTFAVTEKFSLNGRVDWATGDASEFINPNGAGLNNSLATEVLNPSTHADLLAATLTADYKVWANVVTRAEVRWDHSLNDLAPFNNANTDLQRNELTLALNVIYKF